MRILAACAILLLAIGTSGCGDDSSTNPTSCPANARSEVAALHVLCLQYFLNADAEHYVARYAPSYVDLGGGPHGDGSVDSTFFTAAYWESKFTDPYYLTRYFGKAIEDVVDISSMRVLTKLEVEVEGLNWWPTANVDFEMSECDMYATIPAASDSGITWRSIYRKIGDTWLVVAL